MLAWFRRHSKVLMVVLGTAAMAIFGLGPVFDTLASRGLKENERAKEIVATWKGGDITRVDLDQMEMRHYQTQRFLMGVQQAAEKKKGDVVNSLAIPISPIRDGQREMVDDQLITRFLMSERAKEEGMIVSDAMVNDYIDMLSGAVGFSERDLNEINDTVNNRYCSVTSVREQLKTELLANQMQLCCMTAVPIIPNPVESIEFYGRTMEQIECEVLPIEVEKYVGKVEGTPSAAEIKKLYEQGKYEFPDPTGQRPGFKIGRKLNLQYLIADYQTFLQNEMNKLSDEDVQTEYERLIAEKNELVLEPLPVDDGSIQIDSPPPGNNDVTPPPTGEGQEIDPSKTGGNPDDVTPPPGVEGGADAPAAAGNESQSGAVKPEGDKSEDDKTQGESEDSRAAKDETQGNDDQSFNVRASGLQFVSTALQESGAQDPQPAGGETGDTKKPDPADGSAVPAAASQENENQTTESDKPESADASPPVNAVQEPGATGESTETQPLDALSGAKQDEGVSVTGDPVAEEGQAEPKPVDRTPKPLKDVVEDVKRSMCEEATNKAMNEALTKASVMVQDHFEKRLRWEFDNEKKNIKEPEPLDYEALAKSYNLIARETGLVDDLEIANDPIGQVRVFMNVMMQGRQTPQLIPVGQLVFNGFSDLNLYASQTVNDNWGSKSGYLFWASKKTETRIPTLEEAEPQIIKFWKKQKALELALAEAESIKTKVNDASGKKMSELYSERVFQTGAFTWFSNFGSTRYSTPIGVNAAGEEFMKTAFSLPILKSGVAANEPRDTVYVIQSMSESKSVEEIGMDYLENQFFKFKRIPNEVQRVSQLYFQEFNLKWNQEFQDTMGLKFMDR